ncbi:FecR domain-containing protein [Draconibacterium sp. IB214405]|uniref:FecR family protein n=1 Tax=Draconibacterium sp. IB214405 TaxID=3097352 RepID=UPI002A0D4053|nr:FecR domain-containing protein [Draconibacterium sp. IB214405]MDX8340608.1 FecR domain-containing protein [Draconibacterium sp. IB214405]
MNDKKLHNDPLAGFEKDLFGKGKIKWEKSKADVWDELQRKIDDKPAYVIPKHQNWIQWAAAAVALIILGVGGVFSYYQTTIECQPGEHRVAELPDGSTVEMNAASKLVYYPLKWSLQRKLKFEGEGFFNVEKGSPFTVHSVNGTTRVLGTSFNIYARNENYRVTCLTGKVQVTAPNDEKVILLPQNHVELEEGKLVVTKMFKTEKAISWKQNYFFFAGRPLKEVIDEIERQYAVTIKLDPQLNNRNFGSNFSKQYSIEDVLDFVCKPMNLKFEKQANNVYIVTDES